MKVRWEGAMVRERRRKTLGSSFYEGGQHHLLRSRIIFLKRELVSCLGNNYLGSVFPCGRDVSRTLME